jgi:hypothetical protein
MGFKTKPARFCVHEGSVSMAELGVAWKRLQFSLTVTSFGSEARDPRPILGARVMKTKSKMCCIIAGMAGIALLVGSVTDVLANGRPQSADDFCQALKLTAVGNYYRCLLRAGEGDRRKSSCDDRFTRAFAQADLHSPACEPLDDPDRTQRGIQDQAKAVLAGDVSVPPCQEITSGTDGIVTCWLHKPGQNTSTSYAALDDILTQITTQDPADCAPCQNVTSDTPLWLQA